MKVRHVNFKRDMKTLKENQARILELKKLNMKLKNTVIGFKYRLYNKMQKEGSVNLKVGP